MIGVMVQGTSSDVGKSLICTALCRAIARRNWRVTPFKSQNMTNNTYVTKDGLEIGRSQGIQAEAAETEATAYMNPIVLKPRSDRSAEVVRLGKPYETFSATAYRDDFYEIGLKTIQEALTQLKRCYDVIVIEGAGSPVEVNLNDRELVNMKVAELADVPVILVADIDRGGVFASIAGTLQLLKEAERKRIIGVIINKFRGDPTLFASGRKWIEANLHVPVLAVLPYVDHSIEAEDSFGRLSRFEREVSGSDFLDIAVIDLPYFANDSDIEPFRYEKDVSIRFVSVFDELGNPDAVIFPATNNPFDDLEAIKRSKLAKQLDNYVRRGGTLFAIGSGYKMLGKMIRARENDVHGLGFFPVSSRIQTGKTPRRVSAALNVIANKVEGFLLDEANGSPSPFATIDGIGEGCYRDDGRLIGTNVHHCFYDDVFRTNWLNRLRRKRGMSERACERFLERRGRAYDVLADWLESELDVENLIRTMKEWKKHRV